MHAHGQKIVLEEGRVMRPGDRRYLVEEERVKLSVVETRQTVKTRGCERGGGRKGG